ncbi:hypothetical protein STSO111631_09200 [Stackebrandtia soli]
MITNPALLLTSRREDGHWPSSSMARNSRTDWEDSDGDEDHSPSPTWLETEALDKQAVASNPPHDS